MSDSNKRKGMVFFITALLFAAQFFGNYGNFQPAAIPAQMYETFHLTDMQFSSLLTAPMLPSIFLSIVIGLLVDRFGISKMVSICLLAGALGFVIRCFATNYPTMLFSMALCGCGCMIVNSNIAKIASSIYPMDKVSKVVGILMGAANAAMALSFATTALLPSLRVTFLIPAVAAVINVVLWVVAAREDLFTANRIEEEEEPGKIAASLKLCFRSRNLWLAGLTLFLLLGSATIVTNFHVAALTSLKGYSETLAGSFSSVTLIGAAIGSVFLPVFITKHRERAPIVMFLAVLICAVTTYGMVVLPAAGIYVCAFINGALRGGVLASMLVTPVLLKEIGPRNAGTAGGFIITLQLLGAVIVPTYIIVPLGGGSLLRYFLLAAVCMVLCAVVCLIFMTTCGAFGKKGR